MIFSILFIVTILVTTSRAFVPHTMSVIHVDNMDTLRRAKQDIPNVLLVTGKGCRACMRFKKTFCRLHDEFTRVNFYELVLNDVNHDSELRKSMREYSRVNGIMTIPMLIIQDQEKDEKVVSLISGVRDNVDIIEEKIRRMNSISV